MTLPQEFLQRMKNMLGDEYNKFISTYSNTHTSALRLNPLKNTDFLTKYLEKKVPWAENGFYYSPDTNPMGKLPYHNMGLYYIQEPSAMFPAEVLGITPGDIVLDLCASPGGKSTQIALKLRNNGLLISNEIIPKRAMILKDNISRLGIKNAIVTNETPLTISKRFDGFFNKIIVDAPCSGEGMFRKHPEEINEWSQNNVEMCAKRQLNILNTIKNCLKTNGILVYSTCTFSPEENEQLIEKFLIDNPEFKLINIENKFFSHGLIKNTKTSLSDIEKTIRVFPHLTEGEGHFVAKLVKTGAEDEYSTKLQKSNINKKSLQLWQEFEKKHFTTDFKGTFLQFGDNIYLVPKNTPSLDKLKVIYSGVLLGNVENNRFTPSHELALSLHHTESKVTHELSEIELNQYLHGETISSNLDCNGWILLTHKDNPVGWGKCTDGTIKNHYPKYLRI